MLGLLWNIGHLELLVFLFVVLLLFGNRLPSLMRSLGRGVVEFKQGLHGGDGDRLEDDSEESPKAKKINAG